MTEGSGASSSPCPQGRECVVGEEHACVMVWGTTQRCGVREEVSGDGVGNP